MISPTLDDYLALPPLERQMLNLLLVFHAPFNRTRMAAWLSKAGVQSDRAQAFNAGELKGTLARWEEAGIATRLGGPEYHGPEYALSFELRHRVAAHLGAPGLAKLAELVRRAEPLIDLYSYAALPERLARELFLALYLEPLPELAQALQKHRPYGEETPGDVYVLAFGWSAPREGLNRLGLARAQAYLEAAFQSATRLLRPVSSELFAYITQHRRQLDSEVIADAALYLALRGQPDEASALVADVDDADSAGARCFIALTRGDFADARLHARAAVEHTRTKKSRQIKGVTGPLWPWVTLALLTATGDPEVSVIAREQLAAAVKKCAQQDIVVRAFVSLQAFLTTDGSKRTERDLQVMKYAHAWHELMLWVLVARFSADPVADHFATSLAGHQQAAERAGFRWLADELARVSVQLDAEAPATGLVTMYAGEEPWERALRALESAMAQASGVATEGPAQSDERLVWTLDVRRDGSHELTARVQTRNRSGFSPGRPISWKTLHERSHDATFVADDDRRVLRQIQIERGYASFAAYTLAPAAVLGLVGHPRVFADLECRMPVEVVRGEVRVDVQDVEGQVVVNLVPRACVEHEVVCERDGERVLVYMLGAEQRIIAQQLANGGLRLPAAARPRAQKVLGNLVSHFAVSSALPLAAADVVEVDADARLHIQLRRAGTGMRVRWSVRPLGTGPQFAPGAGSANVLGTRSAPEGNVTVRCTRDLEAERLELERVLAACPSLSELSPGANELVIAELTRCLDLLCELRALGDGIIAEWPDGQALSVVAERDVRDMKLQLTEQGSWFQAQGELVIDDNLKLSFRELLDLTRVREGRFLPLDDGRFVALSESLQRSLDGALALSRPRGKQVELHPLALFGVTELADTQLQTDPRISERLDRAREAAQLEPEVPHTFEASLRPYQRDGYAFLSRLAHWGAGACLADDMGLGKTLQTLALLVEHAPRGAALVVAPTSVCTNWIDEARKFAPSLRVVRLAGQTREQTVRELGPFDVLVCSYGVLQQEQTLLSQKRFQVVVLDEAQAIKNASTQRAKAASELVCNVRIALTGTPIENHLGELWSILNFVNPGMLGSPKNFEERFVKPIQRDGDRQASQLLRRIIAPFVLRRRKSEVLDDLPEKTVITLRVEPSVEERAFFAALREQAVARLTDRSKPAEARIRLLAELTRMRRAACHPALIEPNSGLESSKLRTLEALLAELIQGGHRVLVFSQFVDYLTLVRQRLEQLSISYQYLDGSSSTKSRAASVTAFQAGESDVFLISLKAGGFGLNLTAADYVIHLDPWWNPAVEDQASDRAHRIGQTRPVTIYRLVMEGSIEEKILSLHATKRELADDVLDGTGASPALGVEELMDLLTEATAEFPAPARRAR